MLSFLIMFSHHSWISMVAFLFFLMPQSKSYELSLIRLKDATHPEGQRYVMVNENKKRWRRINDTATFKFLWHEEFDRIKILDMDLDEFQLKWGPATHYTEGPPIESLASMSKATAPDDIIEAYSTKMRVLQDNDDLIQTYWWSGSVFMCLCFVIAFAK